MVFGEAPGFFGKTPAVGDFVSRRLPRNFLDPWDQWLQAAIASSREQLDDSWLDNYLTSPVWRFALSAEVAGPLPYAGIMIPSVDKVGRYFPFTLAGVLPVNTNLFEIAGGAHDWYEAAEAVAISILEDESPDIESLDSQIEALGLLNPVSASGPVGSSADSGDPGVKPWHVPIKSVNDVLDTLPVMMQYLTEKRFGAYSLWWSEGSEQIAPALLVCAGLPPVNGYASMLGSGWVEYGWDDLSVLSTASEHEYEAAGSPS